MNGMAVLFIFGGSPFPDNVQRFLIFYFVLIGNLFTIMLMLYFLFIYVLYLIFSYMNIFFVFIFFYVLIVICLHLLYVFFCFLLYLFYCYTNILIFFLYFFILKKVVLNTFRWRKFSKMDDLPLTFMELQVNSSFISYFSSFINEMCDEDYINNFMSDKIFSTQYELIQWVRGITFHLDFVIVTIRSDKAISQPRKKMYVLLSCEKGDKYMKYKSNVQPSVSGTRKCDCPFKFRGKPISNGDDWMLKVICGYHNHDVS